LLTALFHVCVSWLSGCQSLVVNGICVGWNAYLSFVKHKAILPPDHSEAAIGGGSSVAAPARLSSPIPSGAPSSPVERSSSSSSS
jgi:hypothetical protein